MSAKQAKQTKQAKKNVHVQSLIDTLKMSEADIMKLALIEAKLMKAKELKESSRCKTLRQSARNLKFFRHEHTAETIAHVQAIAKTLSV